jgi:WD40 repeat protein
MTRARIASKRLLLVALILLVAGATVGGREVYLRRRTLHLEGHHGALTAIAYSLDGALLASGDLGGDVRLWRDPSGECVLELPHPEPADKASERISGLAFSPDGTVLAIARGPHLTELRTVPDGRLLRELHPLAEVDLNPGNWIDGSPSPVFSFSPSGLRLAVVFEGFPLQVLSTTTGKELLRLPFAVQGAAFVSEDSIAVVETSRAALRSPETGAILRELEVPKGDLEPPLFSPRGEFVVLHGVDAGTLAASGGAVFMKGYSNKGTIVALPSGKRKAELDNFAPLALSSDGGALVVTPTENKVAVLSLNSCRTTELPGEALEGAPVAFSPDRDRVAAGLGHEVVVLPFSR